MNGFPETRLAQPFYGCNRQMRAQLRKAFAEVVQALQEEFAHQHQLSPKEQATARFVKCVEAQGGWARSSNPDPHTSLARTALRFYLVRPQRFGLHQIQHFMKLSLMERLLWPKNGTMVLPKETGVSFEWWQPSSFLKNQWPKKDTADRFCLYGDYEALHSNTLRAFMAHPSVWGLYYTPDEQDLWKLVNTEHGRKAIARGEHRLVQNNDPSTLTLVLKQFSTTGHYKDMWSQMLLLLDLNSGLNTADDHIYVQSLMELLQLSLPKPPEAPIGNMDLSEVC